MTSSEKNADTSSTVKTAENGEEELSSSMHKLDDESKKISSSPQKDNNGIIADDSQSTITEESKQLDQSINANDSASSSTDALPSSIIDAKTKSPNKKTKVQPKETIAKQPSSKSTKPALLDSPLLVEGKRQRHSVERLASMVVPAKAKVDVASGSGTKLGEIEYIAELINKGKADDLKTVHRILFHRPGSAHEIRKNIRAFNGFAFEKNSTEYEKKKLMLEKWTLADLRSVANVLGTEKGTKEEIIPHILDFLVKPVDMGKKPKGKKSTPAKKSTNKKRASSKSTPKKTKTVAAESKGDSDEESDDDDDGNKDDEEPAEKEPPAKKSKVVATKPAKKPSAPTDVDLTDAIKKLLEKANLEKVTMKEMCKMVYDKYPEVDLTDRKDFIKTTVKALISSASQ